jgi:hypothetical protein
MTGRREFLRRQEEIIGRVGWAVTMVMPTARDPDTVTPFAYTVGLTAHDFPELLIAGLDPDTSQALLNDLARRVYDQAQRFTHGQRIPDLLVGYDTVIVTGPSTDDLHPGAALARYGPDRVRLQQIVWPDKSGRFPWDAGYEYPAHLQPLIGQP